MFQIQAHQNKQSSLTEIKSYFKIVNTILLILFISSTSFSAPQALTYQGRIVKNDGTPLEHSNVSFIFQITDPSGQCVIFQEQIDGVNMSNSSGVFDVPIGQGTMTFPTTGTFTVLDSFDNSNPITCNGGSTYTPVNTDGRLLRVSFYDGIGWKTITPDNKIRSVPYAAYALSAQKLGNKVASDFLTVAGLPTCGAGTFLTWSGSSMSCAAVSSAAGGTVTDVTSANSYLSVATGTSTPALMVNVGNTAGTLAAGDDPRFASALQTGAAAGGALSGTYPNPTLGANSVNTSTIDDGAVTTAKLFSNPGVNRLVATDSTTGATLAALTCGAGQLLTWDTGLGWKCTSQNTLAAGSASLAANFTGNLSGDVTGTQSATIVSKISGYPIDFSVAPVTNQVLTWNGTNWVAANLPAGGSGTVTNVNSANGDIAVATGTTTPVLTLNSGVGADQIVKLDGSAKLPAVDGSQLTNFQASQIPNLDAAKITTGTLSVSRGGTGQSTYTDGQLLIGNTATSGLVKSTLTAGAGITITNGNGSITISSTAGGGTVTNVSGTAPISVANGTSTPSISLTDGTTAGEVYRWNGAAAWVATKLNYKDLVNNSAANPWPTVSCNSGEAITFSSVTDNFSCTSLTIATSQLSGTLNSAQLPSFSGGDVTSSAGSTTLTLANSGVSAGTYKSVTVDAKGRVTAGTNPTTLSGYGITDAVKNLGGVGNISADADANKPASPGGGDLFVATDTQKIYRYNGASWDLVSSASGSGGTVTSVVAGTGLNGGTITGSGTISLANTAVTAGSYTKANITVDAQGRITAAANGSATNLASEVSGVLPVANGGTNSSTALVNNRIMASSGGAIVEAAAITANKALISDANGIPTHSAVTNTELGYLSGVTSAVQTQLDAKAAASGWSNFSVMGVNGSGALTAIAGSTANTMLQYSVTGPVWSSSTYPSSTTMNQLLYSSANDVVTGLTTANNAILTTDGSGVPSWSGVSSDIFTQYVLSVGRTSGQVLKGGVAASENLTLESTAHATKGFVLINPTGGNVGVGTTIPAYKLDVAGDVNVTGNFKVNGVNIAAGGVSSVTASAPLSSSGGATPDISISQANTTTNGYLSSADWNTFNNKLSAVASSTLADGQIWVGNGSNQAVAVAPSSDVNMSNTGAFTVTKFQNRTVASSAPSLGSFLKWNNTLSQWEPNVLATCGGGSEVMHYNSITDTWSCDTISVSSATGTLALANGGTGAATQTGAANAILPSQTGNNGKILQTDGTNASWATAPTGSQWTTTGSDIYYNAGKVGIGTTTPQNALDIYRQNSDISLQVSAYDQATIGYNPQIKTSYFAGAGSGGGIPKFTLLSARGSPASPSTSEDRAALGQLNFNGYISGSETTFASISSNLTALTLTSTSQDSEIAFSTRSGSSALTQKMVINSVGNVGIGTTSPQSPLHIHSSGTQSYFGITDAATGSSANDGLFIGINDAIGGVITLKEAAPLLIGTSAVERMRIDASGNVGIGTTSPTHKLEVNGSLAVESSFEGVTSYVNSGASYTIPDTSVNIRRILLDNNATITLPAYAPATARVYSLTIFLKQDGTGSRTVTFAGDGADTIKWDSGSAPTISSTANMITIIQLTKPSDESVWYGSMVWKEN